MNISAYLPDHLVTALDRLAKTSRSSRSAVMREAVELYIRQRSPGAWPEAVMTWDGDRDFPSFESLRGREQSSAADLFDDSPAR